MSTVEDIEDAAVSAVELTPSTAPSFDDAVMAVLNRDGDPALAPLLSVTFKGYRFSESDEQLLTDLVATQRVQRLTFANCGISDVTCQWIAQGLDNAQGSDLQQLDLPNNDIGDSGCALLASSLEKRECPLTGLSLSGNTRITTEGGEKILQSLLIKGNINLERFSMWTNQQQPTSKHIELTMLIEENLKRNVRLRNEREVQRQEREHNEKMRQELERQRDEQQRLYRDRVRKLEAKFVLQLFRLAKAKQDLQAKYDSMSVELGATSASKDQAGAQVRLLQAALAKEKEEKKGLADGFARDKAGLEDELRKLRDELARLRKGSDVASAELAQCKSDRAGLEEAAKNLERQKRDLEARTADLERKSSVSSASLGADNKRLGAELAEAKASVARLAAENEESQQLLRRLQKRNGLADQLEAENRTLSAESDAQREKAAALAELLEEVQAEVARLGGECVALRKNYEAADAQKREADKKLRAALDDGEAARRQLAALRSGVDTAKQLEEENKRLAFEVSRLRDKDAATDRRVVEQQKALRDLQHELDERTKALGRAEDALKHRERANEELQRENVRLRSELDQQANLARERLAQLQGLGRTNDMLEKLRGQLAEEQKRSSMLAEAKRELEGRLHGGEAAASSGLLKLRASLDAEMDRSAKLAARNAELEKENEELRQRLAEREGELKSLRRILKEARDAMNNQGGEYEKKLDALKHEYEKRYQALMLSKGKQATRAGSSDSLNRSGHSATRTPARGRAASPYHNGASKDRSVSPSGMQRTSSAGYRRRAGDGMWMFRSSVPRFLPILPSEVEGDGPEDPPRLPYRSYSGNDY